MASTSIVEATNSPLVKGPASLVIQVEAERSLEADDVDVSEGSSFNKRVGVRGPETRASALTFGVTRLFMASAAASPSPRGIIWRNMTENVKEIQYFARGAKRATTTTMTVASRPRW